MKYRKAISAVIASVLSVIIASVLMPIHANAQDFDKPVVINIDEIISEYPAAVHTFVYRYNNAIISSKFSQKRLKRVTEAILAGTKTVEFREAKPHYSNRILDKHVMAWRDLHDQDTSIPDEEYECADPIRQVHVIHFYDYNGTWSLDVAIKRTGLITITEADIQMLQRDFNCHDYDADPARLAAMGIPESERPALFYFAIDRVLDSKS